MKTIKNLALGALAALALAAMLQTQITQATPFGSAFTYQGRLNSSGSPATNGLYDFRFELHSNATVVALVGSAVALSAVPVTNGLFTVPLDFGAPAFTTGEARWLQLQVATNGVTPLVTLNPRQRLTPTPQAIYAGSATTATTAATATTAGSAGNLTGPLPGSQLTGTIPDARLSSNVALRAGGNVFMGNQTIAADLSVGGRQNFGQQTRQMLNLWSTNYGIGVQSLTTYFRTDSADGGGGFAKYQGGMHSDGNQDPGAGGRKLMSLTGNGLLYVDGNVGIATTSPSMALDVRDGPGSEGGHVHIGGLGANGVSKQINFGDGDYMHIGEIGVDDRMELKATQFFFTADNPTSVRVGIGTTTTGQLLQVGDQNQTSGSQGMMRFGSHSGTAGYARHWDIGVPKSDGDTTGRYYSFVIDDPQLNGTVPEFVIRYDTGNVGIGTETPATALDVNGTVTATAMHWSSSGQLTDDQGGAIELGNSEAVGARPYVDFHYGLGVAQDYNVRIINDALDVLKIVRSGSSTPMAEFNAGGLTVNGTFVSASDRNLKENFQPVEARDVLAKVAALPLSRWNYKDGAGTTHLGPMAQDFRAAFGLGCDDKGIATVDADGVALAAIQGLNQKVEEKDARIAELERRLEKLERLMNRENGGDR